MGTQKKLLSFVIPVFNEETNVEPLYSALLPVMERLGNQYDFEIVFTDNHSTDETFAKLTEIANSDPRIRVYRFSRNFGYQRSILTGYLKSHGDAVIQLDCDLQDPPDLVDEFVRHWEQGYLVVYGIRRSRKENWMLTTLRRIFYRLINWFSEIPLPLDAGDFRLLDRRIIELLRQSDDSQPYLRGAIAALGFEQIGIPYHRQKREQGESKFKWYDLIQLALDGILNHSVVPLRISTYVGLLISGLTLLGIAGYFIGKMAYGQDWPPGFTTITVLILLSLSLNALFLGIIGEYLGRIFKQLKKGPLTIIEASINDGAREEGQESPRREIT